MQSLDWHRCMRNHLPSMILLQCTKYGPACLGSLSCISMENLPSATCSGRPAPCPPQRHSFNRSTFETFLLGRFC